MNGAGTPPAPAPAGLGPPTPPGRGPPNPPGRGPTPTGRGPEGGAPAGAMPGAPGGRAGAGAPPSRSARRAARHCGHRFGPPPKPFSAKNACSPAVKMNGFPQSTHVMVRSSYDSATTPCLAAVCGEAVSRHPTRPAYHVRDATARRQTPPCTFSVTPAIDRYPPAPIWPRTRCQRAQSAQSNHPECRAVK